jgi:hypothetical protein
MIASSHIAFDIDGVFANTMALFLEIARTDYAINHIKYEDINQYFLEECLDIDPELIRVIIDRILEGDFQTELKPVDGAAEVLSDIAEAGPLLFVTARPKLLAIKAWVEGILPRQASRVEVIATGTFEGKADVLKARGIRYFVEDCLEICFMLRNRDIIPILFSQPWNRFPHPFQEVSTWAEIRALIDLQAS